jgi:hypothetical protein
MGVYLIKRLMDEVDYRVDDGRNVLANEEDQEATCRLAVVSGREPQGSTSFDPLARWTAARPRSSDHLAGSPGGQRHRVRPRPEGPHLHQQRGRQVVLVAKKAMRRPAATLALMNLQPQIRKVFDIIRPCRR